MYYQYYEINYYRTALEVHAYSKLENRYQLIIIISIYAYYEITFNFYTYSYPMTDSSALDR